MKVEPVESWVLPSHSPLPTPVNIRYIAITGPWRNRKVTIRREHTLLKAIENHKGNTEMMGCVPYHLFYENREPYSDRYRQIYLDFDHHDLNVAYEEALLVRELLRGHSLDCQLVFTGNKGFHVLIPLPDGYGGNLKGIGEAVKSYFLEEYEYEVESIDTTMGKEDVHGVDRLQYTLNPGTGLQCTPLPVDNPDLGVEGLNRGVLVDPRPPKRFGVGNASILPAFLKVIGFDEGRYRRAEWSVSPVDGFRAFVRLFMHPLVTTVGYDKYVCPFRDHADENPSFTVYDDGWICYGCGRKGAPERLVPALMHLAGDDIKRSVHIALRRIVDARRRGDVELLESLSIKL